MPFEFNGGSGGEILIVINTAGRDDLFRLFRDRPGKI
jgi:hypothetical protein